MNPVLQQPFFQVTLPLLAAMLAVVWGLISTNNRRLDDANHRINDLNGRFDDTNRRIDDQAAALQRSINEATAPLARRLDDVVMRLGRIEDLLRLHDERITRLEERTSPIARR